MCVWWQPLRKVHLTKHITTLPTFYFKMFKLLSTCNAVVKLCGCLLSLGSQGCFEQDLWQG